MKLDVAKRAAAILERIDDLEQIIQNLEQMREAHSYKIESITTTPRGMKEVKVDFFEGKLSTEVFKQNVLAYAIDNFNIELNEIRDELEELM